MSQEEQQQVSKDLATTYQKQALAKISCRSEEVNSLII